MTNDELKQRPAAAGSLRFDAITPGESQARWQVFRPLTAGQLDCVYIPSPHHKNLSEIEDGDPLQHIELSDFPGGFFFHSDRTDGAQVAEFVWKITRPGPAATR